MSERVRQFLLEKDGAMLEASVYKTEDGYSVKYSVNGVLQGEELYPGVSIHYAEDAAENWLQGVKVLNG